MRKKLFPRITAKKILLPPIRPIFYVKINSINENNLKVPGLGIKNFNLALCSGRGGNYGHKVKWERLID